jgi:hypothetical protein
MQHHHGSHGGGGGKNIPPRPHGVIPETHLALYDVNGPGWEAITQDLYDSIAYPAAGANTLTFFVTPNGQGGKTLEDTNMQLAGQMPNMQKFLVETIEIDFQPTVPPVTAQNPAAYGAGVAAQIVNDVYIFRRTGVLQFNVGSKYYLQSGPLKKFPSRTHFAIDAALSDSSTAGTGQQARIAFADVVGKEYHIKPYSVLLIENQNFDVQLMWPSGLEPLPSTNPARIVVTMMGLLYRRSQ